MLDFGVTYPTIKPRQLYGRVVSPWTIDSAIGGTLRGYNVVPATTDFAWVSGQVIGIPFSVSVPGFTLRAAGVFCGTGAGNNFDIGITNMAGLVLASTGATARTASTAVNANMLANYVLPLGDYYIALTGDSTSTFGGAAPAAGLMEAAGVVISTGGYPLAGKTLTWAVTTLAFCPEMWLTTRTVSP